jgi:hypothetical protein
VPPAAPPSSSPRRRVATLALLAGLGALGALSAPGATGALAAPASTAAGLPVQGQDPQLRDSQLQAPQLQDPPLDGPLEVWLLTADRGDEVWEMFGHNALLIRDYRTGQELVWNWGLFNFDDVDFIPRFLRGTMRYTMGPSELEPFLRSYAMADRAVFANRLHLTAAEAESLDAFVRWNFLPENRPYIYDYYRDNCSTRIRDALDRVLGGALAERFQGEATPHSYRWHSRRQVQVTGWVDQGLSFLLGMRGDRPLSAWEVMFLPVEMMELLEGFEVADPAGGMRPLLGPRETWLPSTRAPLPATPPGPSLFLLGLGLGAALLLGWAGTRQGRGPRGSRALAAGTALVWGAFSGALGLLLVLAWFTDHHFIQVNLNLFHLSPLAPVGAILLARALLTSRDRESRGRTALYVTGVIAALSLGVAALQLVGLLRQGNLDVVFVALPLNLAMAGVAWAHLRA